MHHALVRSFGASHRCDVCLVRSCGATERCAGFLVRSCGATERCDGFFATVIWCDCKLRLFVCYDHLLRLKGATLGYGHVLRRHHVVRLKGATVFLVRSCGATERCDGLSCDSRFWCDRKVRRCFGTVIWCDSKVHHFFGTVIWCVSQVHVVRLKGAPVSWYGHLVVMWCD